MPVICIEFLKSFHVYLFRKKFEEQQKKIAAEEEAAKKKAEAEAEKVIH